MYVMTVLMRESESVMSSNEDLKTFFENLPSKYKDELYEYENLFDGTFDDFIGMMKAFKLGMQYQKEKGP